MRNWIKRIFSKEEVSLIEWRTDDSILKYLEENLDDNGILKDSANDLPDEKRYDEDENKLRFAPGLTDTWIGTDESEDSKSKINTLSKLLRKVAVYGNEGSKFAFYKIIIDDENAIGIIDPFLQRIVELSVPIEPYLFNFSKELAFKTKHRNSVKFGIALLGLCQNKSIINEIKTIGLHDEFTVFSTVALSNLSQNLQKDLWELAKKVEGWGKIQIIDRFATMKLTEEQREWLLLEGYKNNIMYEYLAYTCALNGHLHEKLQKEAIDDRLFKSAGEIIEALIRGGPAEDISIYEFASVIIENYIRHAKKHTENIADFLTLNYIKDYLTTIHSDLSDLKKNGWSEDLISNCLIDITKILNSTDWTELTRKALKSTDHITYWQAKVAAQKLNIDLSEIIWEKLKADPFNISHWYDITSNTKEDKADFLIDFAIKIIPLKELATGPKDLLGLGPKYQKYQPLDSIISFLENYPGKGEEIIITGLNSPITRNRNMAINVLDKWKKDNWSDLIKVQIQKLKEIEPNSATKANISLLLQGKELNSGIVVS